MKSESQSLARVLDDEFRRVAVAEDIPMANLVEQVAKTAGCSPRHIYNYRAGKWSIPASLISVFCKRFNSTALLTQIKGAINDQAAGSHHSQVSTDDLNRFFVELLREELNHHSALCIASTGPHTTRADIARLEEETERIVNRHREFFAMIESEFERRQERARSLERRA